MYTFPFQTNFVRQKTPHPKELKAKAHKLFGATGRPGAVPGKQPEGQQQQQHPEEPVIRNGESNGFDSAGVGLRDQVREVQPVGAAAAAPAAHRGGGDAEEDEDSEEVRSTAHCIIIDDYSFLGVCNSHSLVLLCVYTTCCAGFLVSILRLLFFKLVLVSIFNTLFWFCHANSLSFKKSTLGEVTHMPSFLCTAVWCATNRPPITPTTASCGGSLAWRGNGCTRRWVVWGTWGVGSPAWQGPPRVGWSRRPGWRPGWGPSWRWSHGPA